MPPKPRKYTIHNVPSSVDRALRRKAAERKLSLNTLVLRLLAAEAGVAAEAEHHDLDRFFGTWIRDPKVEREIEKQREIDSRKL